MKLLKKSVVSSEIASQKRLQIEEGVKIAQKVDALAQKLAALESQERTFIEGMQLRMNEQLVSLKHKADVLSSDIKGLESKKASLLIPLDLEWESVRAARKECDSLRENIEKALIRTKEKEEKADRHVREAKSNLSNIKVRERELERALSAAIENENASRELLCQSQSKRDESDAYFIDKNKELLTREANIAVKERENEIERSFNEKEREEIIREKAQLADQRSALERALNRTNNV